MFKPRELYKFARGNGALYLITWRYNLQETLGELSESEEGSWRT